MSISLSFQKRFNSILESSDYTRSEIAKLIPLSQSTLSNALTYGIIPSTKTLIKIADFFEISINLLLGKNDVENFIKSAKNPTFQQRFEELCYKRVFLIIKWQGTVLWTKAIFQDGLARVFYLN